MEGVQTSTEKKDEMNDTPKDAVPARGDPATTALVASLVGRTVMSAQYLKNPGQWEDVEFVLVELDDGRVVRFGGYGYDASGVTVEVHGRVSPTIP